MLEYCLHVEIHKICGIYRYKLCKFQEGLNIANYPMYSYFRERSSNSFAEHANTAVLGLFTRLADDPSMDLVS